MTDAQGQSDVKYQVLSPDYPMNANKIRHHYPQID